MSKYIIKNCDNYTNLDEFRTCSSTIQNRKGCYCCKDITDCPLKQIVELCNKQLNSFKIGVYTANDILANNILKLLEIEEVDE
jgi:hypothetical protein